MFDYHSLSPRVGEQEFVVERQFSAPRTLMFQVFTQPEHLMRWWAPQTWDYLVGYVQELHIS